MIIEFFGPPAVGKSTLAFALAQALRKLGRNVALATSARPAEKRTPGSDPDALTHTGPGIFMAPIQRAGKLASAMPGLFLGKHKDDVGANLLKILPPQNWVSRIRLQRYLYDLKQSLAAGRAYDGVTIIDQGYLTALSSMAVRMQSPDLNELARGFAMLPRPDLVICLDAQDYVLQARVALRQGRQNAIERLFEQDLNSTRLQVKMVRIVTAMLAERAWPVLKFNGTEHHAIEDVIDNIVREISAQREAA
jgi:hypothetical protein